ncbi:hypothetical protein BC940DRAFT_171161 [Gongronella butleri]|nr:hypothetical protein BC940DRAFT_171161 [Gongronella butleri]
MSNALLLRLFRSEFFNSWIAVSYLFRYSDNVGIQHYLCSELHKFPISEIEFFLPQLIHLLITRPTESVALECFLIDLCAKSTHMALLTLWYLQAYVCDLSSTPGARSFEQCRRVLNKCQAIVFADGEVYEDMDMADASTHMHKVGEHTLPALVGMGAMLTAIGQPAMTKAAGQIAIAQGRRRGSTSQGSGAAGTSGGPGHLTRRNTLNGTSPKHSPASSSPNLELPCQPPTRPQSQPNAASSQQQQGAQNNEQQHEQRPKSDDMLQSHQIQQQYSSQPELPLSKRRLSSFNPFTASPSLEDLHHGKAFTMSRYLKSAQFKLHRKILQPRASDSALGSSSSSSSSKSSSNIFDPKLRALGQSTVPTNCASPLSPAVSRRSSLHQPPSNAHFRPISATQEAPRVFMLTDDEDEVDSDVSDTESAFSASSTSLTSMPAPLALYPSSRHHHHHHHHHHHRHSHHDGDSDDDDDDDDDNEDDEEDSYRALAKLSIDHRRSLLKSNYFRSEIQFLLALVDIATRLVIVPKAARMSALHAELALLNHNLPAEVCLPLWCPATATRPFHHRVVRISPSDAVVLNSAERAPYLIMIEVLEDEMNFENDYLSHHARHHHHHHQNHQAAQQQHHHAHYSRRPSQQQNALPPAPPFAWLDAAKKKKKKKRRSKANSGVSAGQRTSTGANIEAKLANHESDTKQARPTTPAGAAALLADLKQVPMVDMADLGRASTSSSPPMATSSAHRDFASSSSRVSASSMPASTGATRSSSSLERENGLDNYAERMRTAAVMLAQLQQPGAGAPSAGNASGTRTPTSDKRLSGSRNGTEQIRQKIIREMLALEELRMEKMKSEGVSSGVGVDGGEGAGTELLQDESYVNKLVRREDPSAAVFSENYEDTKARIRAASPYGHFPNWRLLSVIVKQGTDLRQEQFAVQLIREMQRIWQDTGVDVWVKYFRVLVTSDNSGLIETLRNTISVHSIKKNAYIRGWNTKGIVFHLSDYYLKQWGPADSDDYIKAQDAFMRSLAGYSLACFVLQIKDRHNGNILVDSDGHLIHIDFGFMLSNSPGSVGFEMAPFKLPQEYIDILGGIHGEKFAEYKALMKAGFLSIRKHSENILLLVEMMSKDSKQACFQNGEQTIQQLRDRFQLHLTEPQAEAYVDRLIMSSCCNLFTRLYDTFQYYSQVKRREKKNHAHRESTHPRIYSISFSRASCRLYRRRISFQTLLSFWHTPTPLCTIF